MKRTILLALLLACGTAQAAENYVLPPVGTKTLIREMSATRNADGTVTVSGILSLPPDTKILISRLSSAAKIQGQIQTVVVAGGAFSAGPFSDKGKAPIAGPQSIEIISFFNPAWQQAPSVLALVGEDGKKLPTSAVRLNDPEFPHLGGHVDEIRIVQVPTIGEDISAIEHVKKSKLFVQGNGQAVDTVEFIVGWMQKAGGFSPTKWSATRHGSKWTVTLDCQDGGSQKQAQWEYDPASKKVRYLDPLSKNLSWLPAK